MEQKTLPAATTNGRSAAGSMATLGESAFRQSAQSLREEANRSTAQGDGDRLASW